MKPLTANLKILYQRKLLWLLHIIYIGIYIGIASSNKVGTNDYSPLAGIMLMHFIYGIAMGSIFIEIWHKPFTFCFSEQTKAAQNMLLIIWLSLMVLFLLVFGESFLKISRNEFSIFIISAGLLILSYWSGVFFTIFRKWNFVPLIIFIIFISFLSHKDGQEITYNGVLYLFYPWAIFSACVILSCFIYHFSGNIKNMRNWRTMSLTGLKKQYRKSHPLTKGVSNFFTRHILNSNSRFLAHLWGQAYLMVGPFIVAWKRILLISLWFGFLIFISFTNRQSDIGFLIFEIGILIMGSLGFSITFQNSPFHNFLLFERKNYFRRRIFILFINIVFFLCFISVCIFICNQFTENLNPVSWKILPVPIIILPLFGGLVILLNKVDSATQITSMVLGFVISLGLSYWALIVMKNAPFLVDLIIVLSATAITWGFHIGVLYYDSMKRSLC